MRHALIFFTASSALLITSSAIAVDPTSPGNGATPLLTQVNNGSRSIAAAGFEENKGQVRTTEGDAAPFVRYRLTQGNTNIFLLGNGIAYQFNRMHYPEGSVDLMNESMGDPEKEKQFDALREQIRLETYRMDMVLDGANSNAIVTAEGRSADYTNYYTHDALDVHTYTRITFHEVYPGIDWILYTTENGLKYDLVIRPGADPALIRMRFKHHEELYLDDQGKLIHGNGLGRFIEESPVSFQNGMEIPTRFQLEGDLLTFALGSYDPNRTLTIDPARIWGTYYGGGPDEEGRACAVDPNGNVYLAGTTNSTSAIASGGHQNSFGGNHDAFLVKFDPAGVRLWGTYYGGLDSDWGYGCTVDLSGNVYLTGWAFSPSSIASGGHQNTSGGGNDAFLVKFDPDGIRLWGTYYGGTNTDYGHSCAVDPNGNVYLAGVTSSSTGIASVGHQDTLGGSYDAFIVKFDPDGIRLWGTYYGGADGDYGHCCAVDPGGNVYLAGETVSSAGIASGGHQNTIGGGYDAFLVKFDPTGTRLWGSYYGGTGAIDIGHACAVDPSGNVYLAGETRSTSGIASGGHDNTFSGTAYPDAFLAKFDPAGTRLWGTYYGGTSTDQGHSCAVDPSGNVYLAGETGSQSSIAHDGYQNLYGGGNYAGDAFLVKFDPAGTRLWGTYYGAIDDDSGYLSAIDLSGHVYLGGKTRSTYGIASGGHQNTLLGVTSAFLVKFDDSIGTQIVEGSIITTSAIPNPTSGPLAITSSVTGQRYAIADASGRMVVEGVLLTRTAQVDLSSEPAGVYLLKVWDAERTEVIRIVKE